MSCITITFGDCAENHKGMQIIGKKAFDGYTINDLVEIKSKFELNGLKCKLIDLNLLLNEDLRDKVENAQVLIVKNCVNYLLKEDNQNNQDNQDDQDDQDDQMNNNLFEELINLDWDKKALMYGRVVNKNARYNLCFSNIEQEPDYTNGFGRVIKWSNVPILSRIRKILNKYIKGFDLLEAEGNYYHDITKTGIGYHCDLERKKVVGIRLGNSMPLCYQWFEFKEPIGSKLELNLDCGDIYIMSETAKGIKPNKKNKFVIKHSAGCKKYTLL